MKTCCRTLGIVSLGLAVLLLPATVVVGDEPPPGFTSLFNGTDLTGWKVPEGDGGHWKVVDGVIDYDGESEAPDVKHLFSEKEFGDYVLRVDWRIKDTPYLYPNTRIILPSGLYKKGPDGKDVTFSMPDSDSGILTRGSGKAQVNIWCWPVGSGEVWGYRLDESLPARVRAGVVPRAHADNDIGEWNTFEITAKGDRLTVVLNGKTVIENAELPGLPARGPIGLQHHGRKTDGQWTSPPALVQFRNIYIKELD